MGDSSDIRRSDVDHDRVGVCGSQIQHVGSSPKYHQCMRLRELPWLCDTVVFRKHVNLRPEYFIGLLL